MSTNIEFGCIGRSLTHSYSVAVHGALADYDYRLIELEPSALEEFFRKREFRGINVTIPYKQAVIPFLDEIEPTALQIGAVNTVVNRNGKLVGYNTDRNGLTALLRSAAFSVAGKKVMILGTGGTAHTAEAVAGSLGAAEIVTVSRTPDKGEVSYAEAQSLHDNSQIIINATPVGMNPKLSGQSPLVLDCFFDLGGVVDAIYNPLRTPLVLQAEARGIPAAGGLYMLAMQAVGAVALFTDKPVSREAALRCYGKVLRATQNIVLIGMPGCGKTAVGKALAALTGKPFIDTDALIEKEAGMTCRALITSQGEAAFRAAERRVIHSLAPLTGHIIATGGGSVLHPANVTDLKGNGVLVFLNRPPETLPIDESRPLSATRADLEQLYLNRIDIYKQAADITLCPVEGVDRAAKQITEVLP